MKKLLFIAIVGLISTSIYAQRWKVSCPGGGVGYFVTLDGTNMNQVQAMADAWCDNR
jgi:hypothetical protein